VGSVFRTCDALGAHLVLVGYTPKPTEKNLKLINKTAIGAENYVQWEYFEHPQEVLALYPEACHIGLELTKTSQDIFEFLDLKQAELTKQNQEIFLWFGNEIHGIAQDLCDKLTHTVHLPMNGKKESLNMSSTVCAAGYLFYKLKS